MCGIVASLGTVNQIENVLVGLKKLEYRGYDSCGVAFIKNDGIETIKSVGQIKNLEKKLHNIQANIVIGHTRWATHGRVDEQNAHPHESFDKRFAIVHNGIIENFNKIKFEVDEKLLKSQTDTEIFVNLIAKQRGSVLQKLISASQKVVGSFAVALLHKNENAIYVAKRNSPLYVAFNKHLSMAASDISVFSREFTSFYMLENDEFAIIKRGGVSFFDNSGKRIEKKEYKIEKFDYDEEEYADGYAMLSEIRQQSAVLKKTYFEYKSMQLLDKKLIDEIKKIRHFYFIACGTAYHSTLLGAHYLKTLSNKICYNQIASEFRYSGEKIHKNWLYVFVSQSGETADTIACAQLVKKHGGKVLCVTNVPYCTLNKLADYVLPTFAGRELAVASTKAYTAQVFTIFLLAAELSGKDLSEQIKNFIIKFNSYWDDDFSKIVLQNKKVFFIGRQQDYVTSLEAALKLKEIAYLNCLGIAAGELKHGTLALVDNNTLVVAISTNLALKEKVENNIEEVKARGAKVLLISNLPHIVDVDYQIKLENFDEMFMPIVSILPLQKIAFDCAVALGYSPDKPRNLAKSVTVE